MLMGKLLIYSRIFLDGLHLSPRLSLQFLFLLTSEFLKLYVNLYTVNAIGMVKSNPGFYIDSHWVYVCPFTDSPFTDFVDMSTGLLILNGKSRSLVWSIMGKILHSVTPFAVLYLYLQLQFNHEILNYLDVHSLSSLASCLLIY